MVHVGKFPPAPDLGSPVAWAVVGYRAFLEAVAHVWWYEGVKAVGPSRLANVQPMVGVLGRLGDAR